MQKPATKSPLRGSTRILVTSREKEVLEMISLGYSSEEVASTLFLSSETVRTHRKSILLKFKARNTAQMIRIAFELGFLKVRSDRE